MTGRSGFVSIRGGAEEAANTVGEVEGEHLAFPDSQDAPAESFQ